MTTRDSSCQEKSSQNRIRLTFYDPVMFSFFCIPLNQSSYYTDIKEEDLHRRSASHLTDNASHFDLERPSLAVIKQQQSVNQQSCFSLDLPSQSIVTTANQYQTSAMSLQRRKTEMVGSLVLPADMMSHDAATPEETQQVVHDVVEHLGQDLKQSVNLQKRKTEMYGTLIVDTPVEAPHSPPTMSPPSGGGDGRKIDVAALGH
eukprot:scaffold8690_cov190-Amphora_coffeaeformis.AAC.9